MSIEAMKQWLEALEDVGVLTDREWQAVHKNKANELRQAIAEAEKPELMVEVEGVMMPLTQACLLELYKFQEATGCNTADEITKQEPVAEVTSETGAEITMSWWHEPALPIGTKLYTKPQQRKPLTFEQVEDCFCEGATAEENGILVSAQWLHDFARAIEAVHGIKE